MIVLLTYVLPLAMVIFIFMGFGMIVAELLERWRKRKHDRS